MIFVLRMFIAAKPVEAVALWIVLKYGVIWQLFCAYLFGNEFLFIWISTLQSVTFKNTLAQNFWRDWQLSLTKGSFSLLFSKRLNSVKKVFLNAQKSQHYQPPYQGFAAEEYPYCTERLIGCSVRAAFGKAESADDT